MTFTPEKQLSLNYGWKHFWYDPQNLNHLAIREFIKGPFAKPKLMCSVPFISCQYDGALVKFNEGIPDCWTKYITQNLRFFQKYLQNYELMQKEDEDVVSHLRKYRIYLGQGIPDPWTTYTSINNLKTFPHLKETDKHTRRRKLLKKKKERCLCCEKEYLFGCPDKCPSNIYHCPCKDCHDKIPLATDSLEKCRCSEIFHNWLLENATFNGKKKRNPNESQSGLSSPKGSNSESDGEGEHSKERKKFPTLCECFKNGKGHECSTSENSGLGGGDHEHLKLYFCPYVKNFYRRKYFENECDKNAESKPSVSKEIQAEIQPIKYSKTVQTDKSETKSQLKCICHNKCFPNGTCHYSGAWIKAGCPGIHSLPSFCCTSTFTQSPTLACPYSLANHFTIKKPHKNETSKRKKHMKKKHPKEREGEELAQQDLRGDEDNSEPKSKIKEDLEEHEPIEAQNYFRNNKNTFNCQIPPKNFNHLKYLSDFKLQGYLPEDISPVLSPNKFIQHANSKFINFCRGNSSLNNLTQEWNPMEKFKSFSSYKPKYSESSFVEGKINFKHSDLPYLNIRRFNNCDQGTMTSAKEIENSKNDDLITKNISNGGSEGEKSRVWDYVKSQEITKLLRKRRKLLRNRKRRQKLVSSILGYQDPLTKSPKEDTHDKEVQGDGSTQDYVQSKKLPQNFPPLSDPLNYDKNGGSRFTGANLKSRYSTDLNTHLKNGLR